MYVGSMRYGSSNFVFLTYAASSLCMVCPSQDREALWKNLEAISSTG